MVLAKKGGKMQKQEIQPEPKAVLQQIIENYSEDDLENVTIDAARLPEILSSLVPSWNTHELDTLIDAVDSDGTGKLDLSKTSQILIYFLKKQAERDKNFTKVTLRITSKMVISPDAAAILIYFYPQIMKGVDDGSCALQ